VAPVVQPLLLAYRVGELEDRLGCKRRRPVRATTAAAAATRAVCAV